MDIEGMRAELVRLDRLEAEVDQRVRDQLLGKDSQEKEEKEEVVQGEEEAFQWDESIVLDRHRRLYAWGGEDQSKLPASRPVFYDCVADIIPQYKGDIWVSDFFDRTDANDPIPEAW